MVLFPLLAAAAVAIAPGRVTLAFAPDHALPSAVERAAVAEAAAIWSPSRVVIFAAGRSTPACPDDLVLTIVVNHALAPPDAPWQAPLGAVDFSDRGAPATTLTVFVDRLIHMLDSVHLRDAPFSQWPTVMRDHAVGRALGRVIAHEIGHVLSRSKAHSARGLMRAIHGADELVAPERSSFRVLYDLQQPE